MKLATWNVNSLGVRLPHVSAWLDARAPDLLAVQETKLVDAKFPTAELQALGYHSAYSGQKTYNGVAVIARQSVKALETGIPGFPDEQRRVLAVQYGDLKVINLYVPNGQSVGSEKFAYKLAWLAALRDWLAREQRKHGRLIVLGDFNIAPEDRDVYDPAAWAGQVHVSEPERRALAGLHELGLVDVFRRFEQPADAYSWWDYRAGAFRRGHGLRIDLILASSSIAEHCVACEVDREPRRAERPSDHAPVLATFDI